MGKMEQAKTVDLDDARAWSGLDVYDREGEHIGRVTAVYIDTDAGTPQFGLVRTGLFGLRSLLVPLAGAFEEGGVLIVDIDKRATRGAPQLRRDEPLQHEMEKALYAHYGMEPRQSPDGKPRLALWELD
jgi:hypothetical protein